MKRRLSEEDRAFQQRMREIFTTKVPQDVRDKVRLGRTLGKDDIVRAHKALHEEGIAVPGWPVEYGGQDWTPLQQTIWNDEMQKAYVPPPLAFNAGMIGPVIATFASQEMKDRFLPPTAALDIWWGQGFSEPDAGSDLAGLRTTAVRDPSTSSGGAGEYVVNGQKAWTTLGQYADWIFVLARTDPDAKKQAGISMLLVEMDSPGVEIRPITLVDGHHEVNEVFFTDVRVPGDQLVGEENAGWSYAKFLLGNERVGVAPVWSVKRRLGDLKRHAAGVRSTQGSLLDDPLVAARIAELEADVMALELTVLRVAGGSKEGRPDPASSILKLRGTELEQAVLSLAVDLAGPMAQDWDPVDEFVPPTEGDDGDAVPEWATHATPRYLNYRKASIYGGSNEVQRQIIATNILGLRG
jgi:alkylation response protein AidB-like acyl-CoA dehydrogenase